MKLSQTDYDYRVKINQEDIVGLRTINTKTKVFNTDAELTSYTPTAMQLCELATVRDKLNRFRDDRVRIVRSPDLKYIGKVGKCTELRITSSGILYTIAFDNYGRSGDDYLDLYTTTAEKDLEFFENDERKCDAKIHDLLDKEIEKLGSGKKESLHEVKFTIDDPYYENLRSLGQMKEAVNPEHQYSFQDAFRWLLEGRTIKFVNDRRRFKIVDDEIVELLEFQGFSSRCMLHDRFYVEDVNE